MPNIVSLTQRILKVIPDEFTKKTYWFFCLSVINLLLDVFSIFLLVPLLVALLDSSLNALNVFPLNVIATVNKYYMVGCIVLFFLLKNFIGIKINKMQSNFIFKLGSAYALKISKHYLLANYINFKQQKKSVITKDVIFISNDFVGYVLLSINIIISEFLLLICIGCVGLYFNYTVTLLISCIILLIVYSFKTYNKSALEKINKNRVRDFDTNIGNLNNLLNGYLSIKSPKMIDYFLNAFNTSNQALNNSYALIQAKRTNSSKQTEIILVLLLCIVFITLNFVSLNGITPVVFLSIFASLVFKSIPSVNKLNIAFTNLNAHLYTLDIIEHKTRYTKEKTHTTPLFFENKITLKDVTFGYDADKILIRNFNTTIKKGDFIGIAGHSGVGKTTLLNIIAGLITPHSGAMYLDGIQLMKNNLQVYFNLITYITQKPFIYEGSILDNLVLFNKNINLDDVHKVLKALDLEDTINQFPNKLNTYIGNEASNLSGGQLQRICIARAVLNTPKILVLDEATNNLDAETEKIVLNFLKGFCKKQNITLLSVSHHLEATKHLYSKIIYL